MLSRVPKVYYYRLRHRSILFGRLIEAIDCLAPDVNGNACVDHMPATFRVSHKPSTTGVLGLQARFYPGFPPNPIDRLACPMPRAWGSIAVHFSPQPPYPKLHGAVILWPFTSARPQLRQDLDEHIALRAWPSPAYDRSGDTCGPEWPNRPLEASRTALESPSTMAPACEASSF